MAAGASGTLFVARLDFDRVAAGWGFMFGRVLELVRADGWEKDMMSELTIDDELLADALVYIAAKGSLWEFKCPDDIVPAIFARMAGERLVKRNTKQTSLRLTPAGEAFIRVVAASLSARQDARAVRSRSNVAR